MPDNIKFEFGTDFQWDLLRFTVQDKNGYKAVDKFNDGYFTLIEHAVIAKVIKEYYSNNKRIPGSTILKEEIRYILNSREYARVVTKDDEAEIIKMIKPLYGEVVKDGDKILEKATQFKSYVELRYIVENVDLKNFQTYDKFSKQIQRAITDENVVKANSGTALVKDIKERQFNRQDNNPIVPTPFRQINNLTNAGGYTKGSIIVILDRPKKFKTGMLINIARSYLRMKKNVLYVDLENGESEIATRLEQSIMKKTKSEILSGEFDDRVQKQLRKYKRLNSEVVIKRFPALTTTTDTIQGFMDEYYREYGIRFQILIFDYLGLMGSKSNRTDETERIGDAYLDVANLASNPANDVEHVYTSHHVTRPAEKRMATRYEGTDIAKCIDIVRHVQAIFGLNRTEEEERAGYQRLEVVEQRDGKSTGKAVFAVNLDTQRAEELSHRDRREYDDIFSNIEEVGDDQAALRAEMRSRSKGDI